MDVEEDPQQTALNAQWQLLGEHQQMLTDLDTQMVQLTTVMSQALLVHTESPPRPVLQLPEPEKFSGNLVSCKGFLPQCSLYFSTMPEIPEEHKIAKFLSLLTGKALRWATAVLNQGGKPIGSYELFLSLFKKVFDHEPEGTEVSESLVTSSQGS